MKQGEVGKSKGGERPCALTALAVHNGQHRATSETRPESVQKQVSDSQKDGLPLLELQQLACTGRFQKRGWGGQPKEPRQTESAAQAEKGKRAAEKNTHRASETRAGSRSTVRTGIDRALQELKQFRQTKVARQEHRGHQ